MKIKKVAQSLPIAAEEMIPVGTILTYASLNVPNNFLVCDGSAISRTTYKDLFDIIGTTYGEGDGTTTFNIPNMIDKFILGANSNLGTTGRRSDS